MIICYLCHEAAPFDPYVKKFHSFLGTSLEYEESKLKGKKEITL